jgi:uncharacterized protein (DUF302 family)
MMRRFVSIFLGSLFLLTIATSVWARNPRADLLKSGSLEATGLLVKASPYSVEETAGRLVNGIEARGLAVFARLDHSDNAAQAGMELPPTQVIMFGNPNLGTPLMQCSRSIAIDLPQKVLIWQADQGTQVAYNNPLYLAGRHRLNGCGQSVISRMSEALNGLIDQVVADDAPTA